MKDRVEGAIKKIEKNGWVEDLKQCSGLEERYGKLIKLLPEVGVWGPISARQLVFYLHHTHELDFGICPFYEIDDEKQYCLISTPKVECLCVIPQPYCIFRDEAEKPKYPELMPYIASEMAQFI